SENRPDGQAGGGSACSRAVRTGTDADTGPGPGGGAGADGCAAVLRGKNVTWRNECVARDFEHKPVLLKQVLSALQPRAGGRYADGTLGGAGHAAAILAASSPSGWLFGCDRDGAAVEAARLRLAEFAGRFEIRRGNFAELSQWVPAGSCDGVLLDLGVSSPQLDRA